MVDDPIAFEQAIAHLFQAKHNVILSCGDTGQSVQFDGYRLTYLAPLMTPFRIGIECKKWKRAVNRNEVSSFAADVRHCKLHRGIMVSFSGYQSGAIERAKSENVDLFEFRPCLPDEPPKNLKEIRYKEIKPGLWHVKADITLTQEEKDVYDELLESESLSLHSGKLVTKEGLPIGMLDDVVTDAVEREIFSKRKKSGPFMIDFPSREFFLHFGQIRVGIKSLHIEFRYPEFEMQKSNLNPDDWYIMKDVIQNINGLIRKSDIDLIEKKYINTIET